MKRSLALLLILPIGISSACASKHKEDPNAKTTQPDPNAPGGDGTSGGPGGTSDELKKNPIDGIAPASLVLDTGAYTDGPIWSVKEQVLFFTTPLGEGGLYRMKPDGATMKVRDGNSVTGELPIGNTIDEGGNLFTIEAKRITRGGTAPNAPAPTPIASSYSDPEAGTAPFDTLKDAVVSANGTIYATDPGYFTAAPIANRIYRITPAGKVMVVESFDDVPRPNGIALSPDGKTLYVGFSAPGVGVKPFIRRYSIGADGVVGEHAKFTDVDMDQQPDGVEVDQGGNVYVAAKAGITVFKSDATKIGVVAVPEQPTAMGFGGKDLKTLYITTTGSKIFAITVNVPGIVQ